MASIVTAPHALVGDSAPEAQSLVHDRDVEVIDFFCTTSCTCVCWFGFVKESVHGGVFVFCLPGSKRLLSICMEFGLCC